MNRLLEAEAKYRSAGTPSIDRIPVADSTVEACYTAASALVRLIDDADRPGAWAAARNAATAVRWAALTRPRQPSASLDGLNIQLAALRHEHQKLNGIALPATLRALERLIDAASSLAIAGDDELAEQIVISGLEVAPGTGCVVLVNAAARTCAESILGGRLAGTAFLTPRQYAGGRFWARAVVVGVSAWYPNALFSAPRAKETVLVHHRWLRDQQAVPGLFGVVATRPLTARMPAQNPARLAPDVVRPPIEQLDWSSIEPVGGQPKDDDPSDDVPARLILLAGGFGFYLEADADRIRGLDPLRSRGKWIRQLSVAGVGPDTVVVLRRAGSERELLRPRISTLLGDDEAEVRARQAEWKGALAKRLRTGDIGGLRRALGMPDLTLQYARYWAGSISISPHASTFARLLEYLMVPEPAAFADAARRLFQAHLGAGMQLTHELEALVNDGVVSRLESSDSVTLSLETGSGATQITLFRVVAMSPNIVTIPAVALRSPLKMRGTQWLG